MARRRGRGGRGGRRRRRARVLCCGALLLGGPAMLRKAAVARCKRLLQHSAQVDGPVAVGVPPLGQKPRKNVLPPHGHKRSGAGCWGRAEQSHQETPSVHSPSGNVCVTCLRPGVDEDGHVPLDRWGRLRHHCVAHQRRAARRACPRIEPDHALYGTAYLLAWFLRKVPALVQQIQANH